VEEGEGEKGKSLGLKLGRDRLGEAMVCDVCECDS
jgi:hypothetical protein